MSETHIKRCTLVVQDVRRSIAFYRDVLGLSVYYDDTFAVGGKIIPAGLPGARVHLAIMEAGHPQVGKIGLLQWIDPPLAKPEMPYAMRLGIGDRIFVVETPDIAGIDARLKNSQEARLHAPLHDWSPDGGRTALTSMSFFDPDGFFFEVHRHRNAPNLPRTGVKRTTLIVRDLSASLAFYRDVMGMEVISDIRTAFDGVLLPAGEPGAHVRLAILKGADAAVGMLGLVCFLDPPLDVPETVPRHIGIGDAVFVAHANDVHAMYPRIRDSGQAHVHAAPTDSNPPAANGQIRKLSTMSFFDPDGNFFELNTQRPG